MIARRSICPLAQSSCLYMTSSVYGEEVFLGSRAAVSHPRHSPVSRPSSYMSLLAPSLCSSSPSGFTLPDNASCPRRLLPAPGHLLLLFSQPECPSHDHLHRTISSSFKSPLKCYRESFPDYPSSQTRSCSPVKLLGGTQSTSFLRLFMIDEL